MYNYRLADWNNLRARLTMEDKQDFYKVFAGGHQSIVRIPLWMSNNKRHASGDEMVYSARIIKQIGMVADK